MSKQLGALAFLFCGACGEDAQPVRDADGSQFGEEDTNACEEASRTALAMDEAAPNGVRPQDVVDAVNGAHTATLTWADGATTSLTVTGSGARDAAWVTYTFDGEGDLGGECPSEVQVTLDVAIQSDDGALAETAALAIGLAEPGDVSFRYDLAAATGTLDPEAYAPREFDEIIAWMDVSFSAGAISGEIAALGEWTEATGDTAADEPVSAELFTIGSF